MNLGNSLKKLGIEQTFRYVYKDPEPNMRKLMDWADHFAGNEFEGQRKAIREVIENKEHPYHDFVLHLFKDVDQNVLTALVTNFFINANLIGWPIQEKLRNELGCNIPWAILLDPTSACNLHCTGCWASEYSHQLNLSYEDMDRIVTEGKQLGIHGYVMTGGEPMVRKKDVLKLMKKHQDCQFAAYTNSTLIDQALCDEVKKLGNMIFMLSIEGTPETNDARRGNGHYQKVMEAMDLLKKNGILFGTSICYTRQNIEAVTNDGFLRMLADKGAHFGFYFHYMPVGKNAVLDLMPTVEQRRNMIHRIRQVRSNDCDIEFYPMDFQNDGEYVGGCIAGGRNYFHINANGDAEPCVFIHYSNTNIRDNTILEMLQSPLFMAYHEGQPFNRNHLRPCPMLENPELLKKMVEETGAHQTNVEAPEEADELCAKTAAYAKEWAPVAAEEWASETHKKPTYENYTKEKREHPELAAFEHVS